MKLRSSILVLIVCLFLVSVLRVDAQLNFSTGWGKRSRTPPQLVYQDAEAQARYPFKFQPDLDLFLRYYRRLKQIEAERLEGPSI